MCRGYTCLHPRPSVMTIATQPRSCSGSCMGVVARHTPVPVPVGARRSPLSPSRMQPMPNQQGYMLRRPRRPIHDTPTVRSTHEGGTEAAPVRCPIAPQILQTPKGRPIAILNTYGRAATCRGPRRANVLAGQQILQAGRQSMTSQVKAPKEGWVSDRCHRGSSRSRCRQAGACLFLLFTRQMPRCAPSVRPHAASNTSWHAHSSPHQVVARTAEHTGKPSHNQSIATLPPWTETYHCAGLPFGATRVGSAAGAAWCWLIAHRSFKAQQAAYPSLRSVVEPA